MQLSQKQQDVLNAIKDNPKLTRKQYAELLGMKELSFKTCVESLREKGFLQKNNKGGTFSGDGYIVNHEALQKECETVGIPLDSVSHYWYKGEHFSIFSKQSNEVSWEQVRANLIKDMDKYAPKYPVIKRQKHKEPKLFVVDASDPHFGKYSGIEETGESYNLKVASERYQKGIEGLINKVQNEKIEKILFISGNDRNHIDNPHNTTTSGTRQDTDGMWFEHFNAAKKAEINALNTLLTIADVHYVHCPSNHDYFSGFLFADIMASWFRNNKNITFDVSTAHRKYVQYGLNLIGMSHGDGAKEADLPDLMKSEARQSWGQVKYGYWYLHHVHHKDKKARLGSQKIQIEKDKIGVSVLHTNLEIDMEFHTHIEYLRSISGTDSWHHRNGYQHVFKAMEAFLHDPYEGQVSRYTNLF